jgi:hypothetical protein
MASPYQKQAARAQQNPHQENESKTETKQQIMDVINFEHVGLLPISSQVPISKTAHCGYLQLEYPRCTIDPFGATN